MATESEKIAFTPHSLFIGFMEPYRKKMSLLAAGRGAAALLRSNKELKSVGWKVDETYESCVNVRVAWQKGVLYPLSHASQGHQLSISMIFYGLN